MITDAKWIKSPMAAEAAVASFRRRFSCKKSVKKGIIRVSAIGVFNAKINGKRI